MAAIDCFSWLIFSLFVALVLAYVAFRLIVHGTNKFPIPTVGSCSFPLGDLLEWDNLLVSAWMKMYTLKEKNMPYARFFPAAKQENTSHTIRFCSTMDFLQTGREKMFIFFAVHLALFHTNSLYAHLYPAVCCRCRRRISTPGPISFFSRLFPGELSN